MKRITLIGLLLASPAAAQQQDPLVADVAQQWTAEGVQHGNSAKAVQAVIEAYLKLKSENEKLKVDLAAKPEPAK